MASRWVWGGVAIGGAGVAALLYRTDYRNEGHASQPVAPGKDHAFARNEDAASLLQTARSIVHAAQFGVLCTNSMGSPGATRCDGAPRCRAVAPLAPDAGFLAIHLATNPMTRKVQEIKRDNQVSLTYLDSSEMSYVTIQGRMAIYESEAEKIRRWQNAWILFYPQGPGKGYVPLQLSPSRIEVVCPARGVAGPDDTWRPPALVRDGNGLWIRE